LTHRALRFWFCLGVATIAAAIANPLVEYASNARWFGPQHFTDLSNLDVVPALVAGILLLVASIALKVRAGLTQPETPCRLLQEFDRACTPALARLLPLAYGLQILALFGMESGEQLAIWGHLGGGTLWIGGPVAISLIAHAIVCCVVAVAAARFVSIMAATTLHVVRRIRSLAYRISVDLHLALKRTDEFVAFAQFVLAERGIGERAPPYFQA
jgi:hypothetical protein